MEKISTIFPAKLKEDAMKNTNKITKVIFSILLGLSGVVISSQAFAQLDCSNAFPSVSTLWPPNHKFELINILGVTDSAGIRIDRICQDEPVIQAGTGSGHTCPDGTGLGTDTAVVREERDGTGDGRVYHISFTADDGNGGTCTGEVTVCVPHDQGNGNNCVDQGPLFDSTVCQMQPCPTPTTKPH